MKSEKLHTGHVSMLLEEDCTCLAYSGTSEHKV